MISVLKDIKFLSAIAGALVGVIISFILNAIADRRKKRREDRHSIVAELAILGHNYLAGLEELQSLQEIGERNAIKSCLPQLTRLEGNLVAVEIRLWSAFPERRVRATILRFLSRCRTTSKYLSSGAPTRNESDMALRWFGSGLQELVDEATKAAGLLTKDPARFFFVGFRKVTPQDIHLLSPEDELPPWKFSIGFAFWREINNGDLAKSKQIISEKTENLRCKVHNYPVHILLHGKDLKTYDIQIRACCEPFAKSVLKHLVKIMNPHKVTILIFELGLTGRSSGEG